MKFFLTLIFFLFGVNKMSSTILQSFTTTLIPITDTIAGETGQGWRKYVIGLSSLDNSGGISTIYALVNGTKGSSGWLALVAPLTSSGLTRFVLTLADIGDLQSLTLITPLTNLLQLTNLELDGQGVASFPSGLPIGLGGSGSGSVGTGGSSGQGYGYGNFQLPGVSNLLSVVTGLSNNLAFLNSIISEVQQLSQVTNILTSVVDLQSLLGGSGLGGLLGGL